MGKNFQVGNNLKFVLLLQNVRLQTVHIESQMKVLSGGEQAKVRLCKILNEKTNILMLDEPTNHLDPESKEELKRALREYKGGIFLISHEKGLLYRYSNRNLEYGRLFTIIRNLKASNRLFYCETTRFPGTHPMQSIVEEWDCILFFINVVEKI